VAFFWGCDEHSILNNDGAPLLREAADLDDETGADVSGVRVREASEDIRAAMSTAPLLSSRRNNPCEIGCKKLYVHKTQRLALPDPKGRRGGRLFHQARAIEQNLSLGLYPRTFIHPFHG